MNIPNRRNRAAILTEALVALALISIVMTIFLPNIHRLSQVTRSQREHQIALGTLQDELAIFVRTHDLPKETQLPGKTLQGRTLDPAIVAALPEGTWSYQADSIHNGWRIVAALSWRGPIGNQFNKVKLTTWIPQSPFPTAGE
jgi:type II secretory pathway pseudopilin PulG